MRLRIVKAQRCGLFVRCVFWGGLLFMVGIGTSVLSRAAHAQEGELTRENYPEAVPTAVIETVVTPMPMEPPLRMPRTSDRPEVHVVQAGETLHTIALQQQTRAEAIAERNRLTHARLLFAGQMLALPSLHSQRSALHRVTLGETLVSLAARYRASPVALRRLNRLACAHCLVHGQFVRVPALDHNGAAPTLAALPQPLLSVVVVPDAPRQGEVVWITVRSAVPIQSISGSLGETPLRFVARESSEPPHEYSALTGISAVQPQGLYTLTLRVVDATGEVNLVRGWVRVSLAGFGQRKLAPSCALCTPARSRGQ